MERQNKILVVEDDPALLTGLLINLQTKGFDVTAAPNGELALSHLKEKAFDLIILDLMLPDANGMDILRTFRTSGGSTPIIILSALGETETKIEGLTSGADDYITKPFDLNELFARINAVLRRKYGDSKVIEFGKTKIFLSEQKVVNETETVHLTPREYELLMWFINHPKQVFSREELLDNVWNAVQGATLRTVDNFVMNLRKKLDNPRKPRFFVTVRGKGYRFDF